MGHTRDEAVGMSGAYLRPDDTDGLGRMVLALLSEVWIMRDRMAILEKLLAEQGTLSRDGLESFVPSSEFAAELATLRDRLVGNVVGAPIAAQDRSVDGILARAGLQRPRPG